MTMMTNTLGRYFAGRFVVSALGVFVSIFVLLVLVDYIEMVRKTSGLVSASAIAVAETSLFRVPQLLEKMMPFCILIGAMTCYLALSRRLELVVARAAGVSAWQFIAPALASAVVLGILATTAYNPISANLRELSKRMEAELFGSAPGGGIQDASGFWINQVNSEGHAIINAARSEQQGVRLTGLTVFRFDTDYQFKERIEAREATLEEGRWLFKSARRYSLDGPPVDQDSFSLPTSLTPTQVRNSFSTPETVSFWQLPSYIRSSESSGFATAGYRLQYHKLLAQPFLLAAMVMLAAAVSLRFFRFGGVQKMVLSGVGAGFLLYVLSKVTEDLSKAELMHPRVVAVVAARQGGLPAFGRRTAVRRYRARLAAASGSVLALIFGFILVGALGIATTTPASAQGFTYNPRPPRPVPPRAANDGQMLVQAVEVDYDYNNSRVSAVGNVQMFYNGTSVEADKVIYDQKTKRLHAEGNIRMTDADGRITYANIMDLSDDYRDGFVDSLRVDTADQTRMAATRADRSSGNYTVFENGVYTACAPCKDDPKKPPLWQVKGARIIHDQTDKMLYFESAQLEFFGVPMASRRLRPTGMPSKPPSTGRLLPITTRLSAHALQPGRACCCRANSVSA